MTVTITGHDNTDLSVSPVSLTFTPADWKTAQEVTLTANQDADATRDPVIELSFTNSGGDTSSEERTVTILDDEIPLEFSPRAVMEGSNFSLFVELLPALAPPSEDVTFTISGHQGTNIVPGQETLTFPVDHWQKPQILTVQTKLDTDDADEEVTLIFTASGGGFEGLKYTVDITIYDRPPFDEYVSEGESIQSKPYHIKSYSLVNPSVDITVTWSGFQGTDLTVGQAVHMVKSHQWFGCFSYYDGLGWCTPTVQTDISAGQDTDDVDDQVDLQITVTDAPPKHRRILGVKGRVSVTIGDDDDPSLIVDPTELPITEGRTGTFEVQLSEAPLGDLGNNDVTVSIPSRLGILKANKSSLTFTTVNWYMPQEVTLTAGHDDDLVDDFLSIILEASGGGYDLERARISVTITDDDEPELKISPNPVFVNEGVTVPVFFEVSLLAEPSNTVTVVIPPFNNTDLWLDTDTLEFSPPRIKGKSLPVFIRADDDADTEDDKETITLTASGGGFNGVTGEVTIIVNDNDVAGAGLVLDPTSITVPENDTANFNVSLSTVPKADVQVTISDFISQDLSYFPKSLTFTSSDYNTRKTITVTSLKDDNLVDESETLTLTAIGGGFDNVTGEVRVTVDDGDTAELNISDTSVSVPEGSSVPFNVSLSAAPTADVTVTISDFISQDLSYFPKSLTFTSSDYNTRQTITVTSLKDDNLVDESETLTLTASEGGFDNVTGQVRVTVDDGDTAELNISDTSVSVPEGSSVPFNVSLSAAPTADVTVTISDFISQDLSYFPKSLTFTSSDYNTRQTITVTALEDNNLINETETLTLTASGPGYDDVTGEVRVTVKDGDTAALNISDTSVSVPEGSSAPFNVSLSAAPSGDVTVDISAFTNSDLSRSHATLTFKSSDYDTPQPVTVSALEDNNLINETETLTLTASGPGYDDVTGEVRVTVKDGDTAALNISDTSVSVPEGSSAPFNVSLSAAPTADVTVTISDFISQDLSYFPKSLTFTSSDYNTRQTITVTSLKDDNLVDESETLTLTAIGGGFDNVTGEVRVTVDDGDTAELNISDTSVSVPEGSSVPFNVSLSTAPTADVTVTISDFISQDLSYLPTSLTFTSSDYNTRQTITVTSLKDDNLVDESETLTLTAIGGGFDNVTGEVRVTVDDDDTAEIKINPVAVSVQEDNTADFKVSLSNEPSGEVTVTIPLFTEHSDILSSSPDTLKFTRSNYNTSRSVTVSANEDDNTSNETETLTLTASGGGYDDVTGKVEVTVVDQGAVSVSLLADQPLNVNEGESVEVTVELTKALQTTDLTIPLIYEGVGEHPATEDLVDYGGPPSITIPKGQRRVPVIISTTDDQLAEKDETFKVALDKANLPDGIEPGSPRYHVITIVDNDKPPPVQARLSVAPNPVYEDSSATVTAMLDYTLDESITIDVICKPLKTTVPDDYTCPDSITIPANAESGSAELTTEVDDDTDDEQVSVALGTHPSVEIGPPASTILTINDKTPVVVTLSVPRQVTEGDEVTVIAELSTAALRPVMIPIECSPVMPEDYSCPTHIRIDLDDDSGSAPIETYHDDIVEGNETFTVEIGTPLPPDYIAGNSQQVTILDDDQAGIILSPTSLTVDEGSSAGYTIKLSSEPQSSVTLQMTEVTDRITWSPPVLIFTASNWDSLQEVRVEALLDGDAVPETVTLSHTPISPDPNYGARTEDLQVTVTDTDTKNLVIRPPALTIRERTSDDFTVALSAEPQGSVTVEISAFSNGELTRDQNLLTFTPSDWADEQPVRVAAEKDEDAEPDPTETLTLTARDGGYDGVMGNVQVTIEEIDAKGIVLTPPSLNIQEGGPSKTYTVVLSSAPTSHVDITLSGDQGKATLTPASLPFTPSDWDAPKTVTVQAVDDPDTKDETLQIIHTASGGGYDTERTALDLRINDTPLTVSIYDAQAHEHDEKVSLRVELNQTTDVPVIATYETVDGTAKSAEDYVRSRGLVLFDPGSRTGQIQIELVSDNIDESEEQFTVKLTSARPEVTIARDVGQVTIFDKARAVAVRIDDAVITEESVQFTVQLSMPSATAIVVHYRTEDGTASANEDYRSSAGALTFAPGEIEQTIEVELVPTKENQQGKTFAMRLENTSEGTIDKAVATATIERADVAIAVEAMKAYAVRFVRTSTIQIVEALRHRPTGSSCLAGQRMELAQLWATGWTPSLGELLAGCRMMQEQERNRGWLSVWGQGAFTRLRGNDALHLRGEVSTAMLGTDYRWQSGWLTGIMVTHSQGDGSYRMLEQSVQTSLTQVVPYVSVQGIDWGAWLALGYGRGQIEVEALEGSLASVFGAAGVEGKWMSSSTAGLNIHGDVLVAGAEVNKYEVRGEVVRVRVGLQGVLKLHDRVRSYIEANVRQDGGSAETGIGLELGGGLRFASGKLKAELRTQGLLLHSADGFTEWGASGYVQVGGGPVGWMMTVRPSWGLGYGSQLHRQQTILDATPGNLQRTEVELAYGVPLKGGVARSVMGVTQLSRGRMYRLGTQLRPWEQMSISVFGLAHSKRELGLNVRGAINY